MQFLNNRSGKWIAAILSALLLWAGWPAAGIAPFLFIAFVPLLCLEDKILQEKNSGKKIRLWPYSYLTFFFFNLLTTWWIYFASPFGMFGAVAANALLMTIVFQAFHFTRRKLGDRYAYPSLIIYWIAFEFFHMDWDLSWPWLNLGNGFASWANMVQWYEYTGTGGGTLWIWLMNILVFRFLKTNSAHKRRIALYIYSLLVLPLIISWLIKSNYIEESHPIEVVVVQPNIDPYNEKFSGMSSDEQLNRILRLASTLVTDKTRLVVCPETALPDGLWENEMDESPQLQRIKSFIRPFPGLRFVTGATTLKLYPENSELSLTARVFRNGPEHFDVYNSGMQISSELPLEIHHKSKLVPGVEKMPFPAVFGYLDNFAIDLGGITGSLGVQEHPSVFTGDSITIATAICYESIYGDYLGEDMRKGANLICVITNDGWWRDTPGYRQHCQYGRLRAIEHRRSIARSANTGISCFIDQSGEIHQATKWWEPIAIRQNLNLNNKLTFYSEHGDYLGRISMYLCIPLLGTALLFGFRKRKK